MKTMESTKKRLMIEPKVEAETTIHVRELLQRLKKECRMEEDRWMFYCNRYSNRNVMTVVETLSERYGRLPRGAAKIVQKELARELAIRKMRQVW